jgi:hypothetical protein
VIAWLARLWAWLVGRFRRPQLPESAGDTYVLVAVGDEPDVLVPMHLYAVGENGQLWHATMLCPCGCSERISLNLLPDDSPSWKLSEHAGGPTLHPSVWRHVGCRSHFFLRSGRIEWCRGVHDADSQTP